MKANNEKGMTLVEILAALVILGIVFVSFMTIFPQMNLFNRITETKLETMNVAKQQLAEIKQRPRVMLNSKKIKSSTNKLNDFETYQMDNLEYTIYVDCLNNGTEICSAENNTRKRDLYKIHIKVNKDDKLISQTFGYVELE